MIYPAGFKKGYGDPALRDLRAIEELPQKMPRNDQLREFDRVRLLKLHGVGKLMKLSNLEKAHYLYKHALEYNWAFQTILRTKFKRTGFQIVGNLKSNLGRIAQKIEQNDVEGEENNPFRVFDMLRLTIVVTDYLKIKEAYLMLTSMKPQLQVVRVQNYLNTDL